MAERKYYCICDSGCKFETLNKEQILTAITQAVENGTVENVDTGFITAVKTINGTPLKFFVGTQYEYEALTDAQKENLFAIITNDVNKDGFFASLEELTGKTDDLAAVIADILNGEKIVAKAKDAEQAANAEHAESAEHATTATAADRATYDNVGNRISERYAEKSI